MPKSRLQAIQQIEQAYSIAERASYGSIKNYLDYVVVDAKPEPLPFGRLADPWQRGLLSYLAPAIEHMAGLRKEYTGPRCFWLTLPRGHDKTSSIGRLCSWAMAFARRKVTAVAAAADQAQAASIYDAMESEARLNPWLQKRLDFKTHKVCGVNNSYLKILSAEAFTKFGLRADFIIFDELTHWESRDLWDALYSGSYKRPGFCCVVITNAGVEGTWQWDAIQLAKKNRRLWWVYEAPGTIASWMNKSDIEDARQMLLPIMARRLIDNVWTNPDEDCGFVTTTEAKTCEELGQSLGLVRQHKGKPETFYYASIDYAAVKDRCCMSVGHWQDGVFCIDRLDIIQGSRERRVPIQLVDEWIEDISQSFNRPHLICDPHQLEATIQKYDGLLTIERFAYEGGKKNYELASNLRSLIINKKIAWFPGAGELFVNGERETLTEELAALYLKPVSYGFKIAHSSSKHDDRTVTVGMMALAAVRTEGQRPFVMREWMF